ncbi:MAG: phosphotransferase [Patescibacteria group bacterium]|nr:phosphotransferase [Patescibacteria group bacterium]
MKKHQTILNTENIGKYLQDSNIVKQKNILRIEEIREYTNVNYVYEVLLRSRKKIYLKQAFDYVKIAPRFSAPLDRQFYEYKSLLWFSNYWKGIIPEVIIYDHWNEIIVMSEAGKNFKILAAEFKDSRLHFEILPILAKLTAKIHAKTFDTSFMIRPAKENQEHIDFIVKFRLEGSRALEMKATEALFLESLKCRTAILYGDFAAKNILVGPSAKVAIVDFQNVVRFDPAFDLGYLLAHWYLEINTETSEKIITLESKRFLKNYTREFWQHKSVRVSAMNDIISRTYKYIGAIMLHRLSGEGRNPNYLARKSENSLIEIARGLLNNQRNN